MLTVFCVVLYAW